MSSVINTNIAATRTSNIYNKNNANMNTYLSRVATGQKINSVKDNASQWAISEKMRERINSLSQANQNVQNDNALLKTAEGGISNTVDILRTLKARAINAADGTLQNSDRELIQKEVKGLIAQIDDNANKVTYNGIKLLDGTASGSGTSATKAVYAATLSGSNLTSSSSLNDAGIYTNATADKTISAVWKDADDTEHTTALMTTTATTKDGTIADFITTANTALANAGANFTLQFVAAGGNVSNATDGAGAAITLASASLVAVGSTAGADNGFTLTKIITNNETPITQTFSTTQAAADAGSGALDFQIGDDSSLRISANLPSMKASTLGIDSIDVSTVSGAMSAMSVLDSALTTALSAAADVGALEQRLGYTADNLTTMSENLEASDSAIRDSDIAKDMTNYMKYAVLSQASQYMLAQAGQNAFQVLNLLQQ